MRGVCYLLAAGLIAGLLRSTATGSEPPMPWRVWLEPKSMRAAVTAPLPGAQRTELAAGFLSDDGPAYLARPEFESLGLSWEQFALKARPNASADLQSLKPKYVRDRRHVIEYAVLTSDRPVAASAVLAPEFLTLFKDTLGPKVLVVVPNRFTAYVFSGVASNYQDYWPMIFADFRATAYPVSVEVFEVSKDGFRAVGVYEEP